MSLVQRRAVSPPLHCLFSQAPSHQVHLSPFAPSPCSRHPCSSPLPKRSSSLEIQRSALVIIILFFLISCSSSSSLRCRCCCSICANGRAWLGLLGEAGLKGKGAQGSLERPSDSLQPAPPPLSHRARAVMLEECPRLMVGGRAPRI